jgi:hypothetical protein
MRPLRHSGLQRVKVLFTIALIFIPLVLSGHFHTTTQSNTSDSCAICVVSHHSPAARLSLLPVTAPVLTPSAMAVSTATVPAHVYPPLRIGRAPPAFLTLV